MGAKKVEIDGIQFDSILESRYYSKLKKDKEQGLISDFKLQPKFMLLEGFKKNGKTWRSITYSADFEVLHNDGRVEIIDVKGAPPTQVFEMRRKLFEQRYDHELKVITYAPKYGGWVDYYDKEKARKISRKK